MHRPLAVPVLALVVLLALPAATLGQVGDTEPPVEIGDAEIDGLVDPLTGWRAATIPVSVGCDGTETPGTRTTVTLAVPGTPDGTQVSLNRSRVGWTGQPGDCPAQGTPYRANLTVRVAVGQGASGFQTHTVRLEATVEKTPPPPAGEDRARAYGPYNATLSFTPGYHHEASVDVAPPAQPVSPGGGTTFHARLESRSNAPAEYALDAVDVPAGLDVHVSPATVTLAPGQSARIEVRVTAADPLPEGLSDSEILAFEANGSAVDPRGGPGETYRFAVPIEIGSRPGGGAADLVPAPALPLVVLALAGIPVALRRRS